MKKLLFLLLLICCYFGNVTAQWHVRSCEVQDIQLATQDEFNCLWKKANTVAKVGKISFAVGAGLVAIGGITMLISDPCCSSGALLTGFLGLEAGVVIAALSIPIWSVGSSRLKKLRASPQYQVLQIRTVEMSPFLSKNQLNRQPAPGVALTFRF